VQKGSDVERLNPRVSTTPRQPRAPQTLPVSADEMVEGEHPWHFNYKWNGVHHRISLDK